MASLISGVSKKEQRELLQDLNYLNTGEIKKFCERHGIPHRIAVEMKDGSWRRTKDDDRKGVMLQRVRHFLRTGGVSPETRFRSTVVCFDDVPQDLAPTDRLFYGRYDKSNRAVMGLLKELTGGEFKDGAIARILAREFWSRGGSSNISKIRCGVAGGAERTYEPQCGVGLFVGSRREEGCCGMEEIACG